MSSSSRAGVQARVKQAAHTAALFAGATGALMVATQAFAQDGETTTTVDTLTANGDAQKPSSPKYVAPLLDTPQTVTVVPAEIIQAQNLMSLRDILSTVPGITFGAGEGGGGYGDSINLRGYAASNNISTDGLRDSAQYTRSDPFNLEQLEVTNGASSVYGGSGAVGGSINLQSKAPMASDFVVVTAGAGTDAYGRATIDANRTFNNGVGIRLNAMVHENDVPGRDVDKMSRWGLAPSLMLGIDSMTQATFSYFRQHDDNTPQYGVPYASNHWYEGPLPGTQPNLYYGYRNVDQQVSDVDAFTARFDHEFAPGLSIRNLARWQQVDQTTIVDGPEGNFCLADGHDPKTGATCGSPNTFTPTGGSRGNMRITRNTQLINQTDLLWKTETGGLKHSLNLGAAFSSEDFHMDSGNVLRKPLGATPNPVMPTTSISNPDTLWTGPVNRIATSKVDGTLSNQAIYLFDAIELSDQWQINGGYRIERSRGTTTTGTLATPYPAPPASPVITQGPLLHNEETLKTYRLGLVFKPTASSSLYAAFGNAETPSQESVRQGCATTTTSNTCNTDPEIARNIEIGGKWETNDGKLLLTGSVFRNERTNYRVASNDPASIDQVTDGSSRVEGVALGASGKLTKRLAVFANYTHLKSKVLQGKSDYCVANPTATGCPISQTAANFTSTTVDPTGRELTNTPNDAASLWVTYEWPGEIRLGAGVTWSGDYLLSNTNISGVRAPGYTVSRISFSRPLGSSGVAMQLNLNNIFDEEYYTRIRSSGSGFGWATPGEGRSASLTLNKRF